MAWVVGVGKLRGKRDWSGGCSCSEKQREGEKPEEEKKVYEIVFAE